MSKTQISSGVLAVLAVVALAGSLFGPTVVSAQRGNGSPRLGYVLAKVTITDQDTYGEYQAGFGAILRQYEGEVVAADRDPAILEGEWSATLTVLLRFATREQALEWYNSEEYQELVQIRHAASTADLIVIEGRP